MAKNTSLQLKRTLLILVLVMLSLFTFRFVKEKAYSWDLTCIIGMEAGGTPARDNSYVAFDIGRGSALLTMNAKDGLAREGIKVNDPVLGPQQYAVWKANHGGLSAIYFFNTDEKLNRAGFPTKAQALAMAKGTAAPAATTATAISTNASQIAALQANLVSLAQQYQDAMARGDLAYAQKCVDLTNVINAQILALQI